MDLKEIVSIAGVSGLHKIIGRSKNGLILETMSEPKKRFATGMHDKVSVLEDISMYTEGGDVQLSEVFVKLNNAEQSGNAAPGAKDDSKVQRAFVNSAIRLDNERVYDSDIKKLITWYNLLKDKLDFSKLGTTEEEAATTEAPAAEAETAEAKPKKTAAKKTKAAAEKEVKAEAEESKEEKPKKTAAKKTAAPKTPKAAAPKKETAKVNTKGAGNKNTYRPKSV